MQYTLRDCRTSKRHVKQYTNNINRPGNTSISNTWIQDKGNSSRWAIQAHSTTTRAKRNYTKHMRRKPTCARNRKIHKDGKRESKKYCHYTTI